MAAGTSPRLCPGAPEPHPGQPAHKPQEDRPRASVPLRNAHPPQQQSAEPCPAPAHTGAGALVPQGRVGHCAQQPGREQPPRLQVPTPPATSRSSPHPAGGPGHLQNAARGRQESGRLRSVARPRHRRPRPPRAQDPSRSLLHAGSPHPAGTAATAAPKGFCLHLPQLPTTCTDTGWPHGLHLTRVIRHSN